MCKMCDADSDPNLQSKLDSDQNLQSKLKVQISKRVYHHIHVAGHPGVSVYPETLRRARHGVTPVAPKGITVIDVKLDLFIMKCVLQHR